MTGDQRIAQEIIVNARAEAEQTLKSAQARAEAIAAETEQGIQRAREETRAKAQAEGALRADRIHRMAELDARKDELAVRREAVDAVFAEALKLLGALPKNERQNLLLRLADEAAAGGERIAGAADYIDADVLGKLNGKLAASGRKPAALAAAGEARAPEDGFLLIGRGSVTEITLSALISSLRESEETAVSNELCQ